jgi:two-component system, chemotaxis family, CheB/CheR fusion protein
MAKPPNKRKRVTKQPPANEASTARRIGSEGRSLHIVGIGASAGGLEALGAFLRHVPDKSGLAFIVVQHLDPTHKDMMVELLQRSTRMVIQQIRDRMRVEANCVYVIPPNKDLSILRGVLHLMTPAAPRGLRLPIDFFFRSLAADQGPRCVGVILSGMGSDGTLGLRAIKEQAGAVFVQAPASAKFDAMPRSAIDAELADVVAPVEDLPAEIARYLARAPGSTSPDVALTGKTQSAIEKICVLLRSQTGHDFSQYKQSTVYRRIERRMGLHQIDSIVDYVSYLQQSPQEAELLFKELLIGVTRFFRDPAAWEHLKNQAIPLLLSERASGEVLRAWVPGCSTGEEAYSLAIVFKEALAQLKPPSRFSLQIFATDLDKDAIDRARRGVYASNIAGDVSAERLHAFFVEEERCYRVSQEIREMVTFAQQNIIMDPPFTKLDIVSCRNLLIYLGPELQKRLLPLFHYSLNPHGILFLGSAETIGAATDLFAPADGKLRIYRRVGSPRSEPIEFPATFRGRARVSELPATGKFAAAPNLQTLAEHVLLQRYSPAAALTNEQGDILYTSGRTGKYLEPAAGKANWNIHAMAREGLRFELDTAFRSALRDKCVVVKNGVTLEGDGALVDVTIEPLQDEDALSGMVMIVFADAAAPRSVKSRGKATPQPAALTKIERELQRTREELQTTYEQMQASQQELTSANEELQSTNEELMTSKEEMQSLNEELQTVNHELQSKVDELSYANDDLRNLLDSTDIATLFLDQTLRVRRFTAQMTKIIKLIPSDLARPITDLSSDLIYPELAADARDVLQTLVFKEKAVTTTGGGWFSVRIMPYRTLDNRINGVVITFVDITAAKKLEATLRERQTSSGGTKHAKN